MDNTIEGALTVGALITKLKKFPQDAIVVLNLDEGTFEHIDADKGLKEKVIGLTRLGGYGTHHLDLGRYSKEDDIFKYS